MQTRRKASMCLELHVQEYTGEEINDFILLNGKTVLFTIALKNQISRSKSNKNVQEFYPENYKHCWEELKKI